MTPTEIKLTATYGGPVVRLEAICGPYLQLSYKDASKQAALNQLPFPAYRLRDSRRAPLLVDVSSLAAYLDEASRCAKQSWQASQV